MTTSTTFTQPGKRVTLSRLLWVGPLTIITAIVANIVLRQIAVAVLNPDPQFMPLQFAPPIAFTFVGVLGAVIVYALIGRFSRRPIQLFRRVALWTMLISLIPDLLMLATGFNPGTTLGNVVVLMLMHVVAWAISVGLLTRLASDA